MPTSNAPPRLSINVGESEYGTSKDIELGKESEIITNVGKFKSLFVLPTRIHDNFRVTTGKYARPSFLRYMIWFGPALLISLLSPLPIFVGVTLPNMRIQDYASSECTTVRYYERKYVGQEMDFIATLRYVNAQGEIIISQFVHHAMDSDTQINLHLQDFYSSSYENGNAYHCYYRDNFVIAADSVKYTIDYATNQGWQFMGGMVGAWVAVILIIALGFYFKSLPSIRERREVSKNVFEGPAHPQMEVVDWGDVPAPIRQSLHALMYNYLIPQDQEVVGPDAKKYVKFNNFTFSPRHRATILVGSMTGTITLVGVGFAAGFAFKQDIVALAQLLWSLAAIFSICPTICACSVMCCATYVPFSATAEVTCKNAPTEDIRIANAYYSPLRMIGMLLTAAMFRTVV